MKNKDLIYPNEYKTSVYLKNIIKAKNIIVGDYTYYDSQTGNPLEFEDKNVLFNYDLFGDKLIIGNFCCIAEGATFIMGAANHRLNSASGYPFNIMNKEWAKVSQPHLNEFSFKGDIVIGNDVWIGHKAVIMPGVKIGNGSIIGAFTVIAKDVPPYSVVVGNPGRIVKTRFDNELIQLLLEYKWWDKKEEQLIPILPYITSSDIESLRAFLKKELKK